MTDRQATAVLQVSTATATREEAIELAESAVRATLAASAQVYGPVASVFWHGGEFGTGEEWVLVLKTTAERYDALEAHLLEHHPWSNPEVSATRLEAGSGAYLGWIRRVVTDAETSD